MSALSRLRESFKGSASRRILIVGGAIIVGGVAYVLFNNGAPPVPPSNIPQVPVTTPTVQGKQPVTQQMDEELATADQQRADAAVNAGGSAIPTVRATPTKSMDLSDAPPADTAPEITRPQPPVLSRPTIAAPAIPAPTPVVQQQRFEARPIAEGLTLLTPPTYPAAKVDYYADPKNFLPPPLPVQAAAAAAAAGPESRIQLPLPGTILYAEMISEANSDSPGPIMAQIVQGPLSGARLIGSFQVQRETLVLSFNTLTLGVSREGDEVNETIPIQALAVDTATIGTGVSADVDYHLLQNLGIGFAAAFIQGYGEAMTQTGQTIVSDDNGTTVTNPALDAQQQLQVATGTALGSAGETIEELFGNRPVTVKIRSGAGIGVFFLPTGNN